MILSRICTCYICGDEEITDKAVLPTGWAVLWDVPVTICEKCLVKWGQQYGEKPMFWLEGGVKEVSLFDEWS